LRAPTLARKIAALTLTKKAHNVLIMDLRTLTSMTDFFVVASADSDIQVKAIADAVEEGLAKKGTTPWHTESGSANWYLLDYVDVVLHIFHKNTRSFYNLEKLWGDAKFERMSEDKAPKARRAPVTTRSAPPKKKKVAS
jgi:ribosome-associated protein